MAITANTEYFVACGLFGHIASISGELGFFSVLTFNPIKLVLLIGWVYLCLYTVQRLQFSPLVPKNCRTGASLAALFLGPLFAGFLVSVDIFCNYSGSEDGRVGRLKWHIRNIFSHFKNIELGRSKDSALVLMDSSGRDLKEIYGHSSKKEDRHILSLTEEIISDALDGRASDILIDPKNSSFYTIRLRIDGVLSLLNEIKYDQCQAVINSIKAVSGMDIAERRRPQDGAFTARTAERAYSFRVASAGVVHGEKLSVRVLNYDADSNLLKDVGMTSKQSSIIKEYISKPSGMILVCGPTGSGKTTTLYAMLNEIDFFTRNVITVEDPIECVLSNASQIEINPRANITFANSLRSILRQDPDVICVGEIRDEDTAAIALKASQTGHLVFATIHSNSNASTLLRLIDLGVSPMLVASGLDLMISQRLIRKLCENCKVRDKLTSAQIEQFRSKGMDYNNIYTSAGCEQCNGTGFYGRIGIFDVLPIDRQFKAALAQNRLPLDEMRKEGDKRGKSNLVKEAYRKVFSGVTSLQEIERVIG